MSYLTVSDLDGIWSLGVDDVRKEAEWLYTLANNLVVHIASRLGGTAVSIPRNPRRAGFHVYSFYYGADLAQILRYARSETELDPQYLAETIDLITTVMGIRVADLLELTAADGRIGNLPVPDFDWTSLQERSTGRIVLAAQGRRLLLSGKPLPSPMAQALTGWTAHRIGRFHHPDNDAPMKSKKRKGITYYDAENIDELLKLIEETFFAQEELVTL